MGILDNPEPAATPNGATAPLVRRNVLPGTAEKNNEKLRISRIARKGLVHSLVV